jgi:hypothetical protein
MFISGPHNGLIFVAEPRAAAAKNNCGRSCLASRSRPTSASRRARCCMTSGRKAYRVLA